MGLPARNLLVEEKIDGEVGVGGARSSPVVAYAVVASEVMSQRRIAGLESQASGS
jgi:hypothetical protein